MKNVYTITNVSILCYISSGFQSRQYIRMRLRRRRLPYIRMKPAYVFMIQIKQYNLFLFGLSLSYSTSRGDWTAQKVEDSFSSP